jgi:hypothetical protein
MNALDPHTVTREQEISSPKWPNPHFVLLGAGADPASSYRKIRDSRA